MRKKKFPQPVSKVLDQLFYKKGWHDKLKEYRIWTHWESLMGPKLSARCRPTRLRHGTLTVAVSSATWMTQLQFMKPQLVQKINSDLKIRIKDIFLVIQPSSSQK